MLAWRGWIILQIRKNNDMVDRLLEELSIEEEPVQEGEKPFEGLTFVITGSVEHFANRKELQELIESKGRQSIRLRNLQNRISHQ